MSTGAKIWYVAAAVWAGAFVIAVVTGNLVLVGLDIVMVILCLVVAAES